MTGARAIVGRTVRYARARMHHHRHQRRLHRARVPLADLDAALGVIRRRSSYLALTPATTNTAWMGVHRATHALFPASTLDIPHVAATVAYTPDELREFCRLVAAHGFSQVVLSGLPPAFMAMAQHFHRDGLAVGVWFHGFLAECGQSDEARHAFATLMHLLRGGVISKLACCKKGLPETIERLTGHHVHRCVPATPAPVPPPPRPRPADGLHLGVLAQHHFRKNIETQLAAALLVERAFVHTAGPDGIDYWRAGDRVIRHPALMTHDAYRACLASMDVNLHASYSESWGQVTTESLAQGVPCIVTHHSDVFDDDPALRACLVSPHFDDPPKLAEDIRRVVAMRHDLANPCRALVGRLNARAAHLREAFLAGVRGS